uniref:Uncharacterized protein n=1 Tax=Myoviridae sp. ctZgq1 TaxID=2826666 RepID=A0A8S5LXA7_9CAUD|nr:MAG TPA: hypothetical protein [Myoviridae sp. ctZgq1]
MFQVTHNFYKIILEHIECHVLGNTFISMIRVYSR